MAEVTLTGAVVFETIVVLSKLLERHYNEYYQSPISTKSAHLYHIITVASFDAMLRIASTSKTIGESI